MPICTGLSGNEMFCLNRKGFSPGELVVGNSVYSMGFVGSIGSGLRVLAGGEVTQVTEVIHDGRLSSFRRMVAEAERAGGVGITGVTNELVKQAGNIEYLAIGSTIHRGEERHEQLEFTTSADGQSLYCQIDSGFRPIQFVFGNVAYSIGLGGGIGGMLRSLSRGEVHEFSEVFNRTRHLALERIVNEARGQGANAVVGVETSILPFSGMQEMVMIGTASWHDALPPEARLNPVSSDLTSEEMWNLVSLGYLPVQIVLGVSVYSLGLVGGITSAFKSLKRGEIEELTTLVYEARENAIARIRRDAEACGADDVVGVKTYVYSLGSGIIEFMAIGTAVRKAAGVTTLTPELPPQAIIKDKDTFVNAAETSIAADLNKPNH
jgi:uncharacterized protein YbjQ (UPF0145 family)